MSKSTISTFQLFEMFPDAESARLFLESRIWADGVTCPSCKGKENITSRIVTIKRTKERVGGFYRCNPCQIDDPHRDRFRAQPHSAAQVALCDVPACHGP